MAYYPGQRLSLKDHYCTVRYVGPVQNKSGEWLGVEWDDSARGKHDGTFDGVKYFECRSTSATVASFLRPNQTWDEPRSFYHALREKYMSDDAVKIGQTVYFSSKQAEEVGFEKFAKRQAALQGIHVVILDHMRIRHVTNGEDDIIRETCKDITELDVGGNLFESLDEILSLVILLPKLVHLILDGNRFATSSLSASTVLPRISTLSLSNTLLQHSNQSLGLVIERHFANVKTLKIANDEARTTESLGCDVFPAQLAALDISGNNYTTLSDLRHLSQCHNLQKLNMEKCHISNQGERGTVVSKSVTNLDLAYNSIDSWDVVNALRTAFPAMTQLRMTGNTIYTNLKSATGKTLMAEDGYMLTIARLPQLDMLNYSKITEKERLNAEKYYLNEITAELTMVGEDGRHEILARHPRWNELCEEYGEPVIPDQPKSDAMDPRSLAARLISISFVFGNHTEWQVKIPKSYSIYSVLGILGKRLNVMPLQLRLVWETGERDPLGQGGDLEGISEWDSDEEESDASKLQGGFVAREVEWVAGTRTIGTYVEGNEAIVRVERRL